MFEPICGGFHSTEEWCGANFNPVYIDETPFQSGTQEVNIPGGPITANDTFSVSLVCTSGCDCSTNAQCDDGRECTRDSCIQGNCSNVPDDTLVPQQVDGDCRSCVNGEVKSLRQEVASECETIRGQILQTCAESGSNWLVHWMDKFAGVEQQFHYCETGTVPAASELTICDGMGACTVGQPVKLQEQSVDRMCHNAKTGQDLQFICNVLCTSCQ
jgi:hypothetical protein